MICNRVFEERQLSGFGGGPRLGRNIGNETFYRERLFFINLTKLPLGGLLQN
jgi:hypothetical protein